MAPQDHVCHCRTAHVPTLSDCVCPFAPATFATHVPLFTDSLMADSCVSDSQQEDHDVAISLDFGEEWVTYWPKLIKQGWTTEVRSLCLRPF